MYVATRLRLVKCYDMVHSLLFGTSLGLGSTIIGSKSGPYPTQTECKNRRARSPTHSPDFRYIDHEVRS